MDLTRLYYERHAKAYADDTLRLRLDAAWKLVSQVLRPKAMILDLGCGAGRDLVHLAERGFRLVGVDYAFQLASVARAYSNQRVVVADFRGLPFKESVFDAVWAVASLLHLQRPEIAGVLSDVRRLLRVGGILISSMQQGNGSELAPDGRRFELYEPEEWKSLLREAGFAKVEERPEAGATVKRKTSAGEERDFTWFVTTGRRLS